MKAKHKSMRLSELKRLTFCNSDQLLNKQFVIEGQLYEWVGFGMVECEEDTSQERVEVVEG